MNRSIVKDMRQLCAEVISNKSRYESYFKYGFAYISIARERTGDAFIYSERETPICLEQLGIISIADQRLSYSFDDNENADGYLSVEFHFDRAERWLKKELSDIISILPDGWEWTDNKKKSYQFGGLGNFSQRGKVRNKVFTELMDLYMLTPQGVSIDALFQRTGVDKRRLRIEINFINKRLDREIGIHFESQRKGYYYIIYNKKPQFTPEIKPIVSL